MTNRLSRGLFAALIASMVLMSAIAPVAMAAQVNHEAGAAPQGEIATDVTVSSHDRSTMSPLEYEDDSGDLTTLPASLNTSDDVDDLGTGYVNAYSFTPTDIQFEDAGAFPHANESKSAVDNESAWTTIGANSGKASVSDVTTAPGVEAVEIATDGSMGSGDVAGAEYTDFSVTSDVDKRYLQLGLTVDTLDSDAVVEVRANDSDGDYVEAEINASRSSGEDYITNATGDGIVYQRQVGSMTVEGNGDGSMQEIQEIEVRVLDADANVDIMALNVERLSKWTLATERADTDDDDEFETNTIYEHKTGGDIATHGLSTMGSVFDSATINDLTYPVNFAVSDLPDEDVNATYSAADSYPAFDSMFEAYYRIQLPDAYDLSYANAELQDTVSVPSGRYETVEYAEGVSDTDFEDISSWTSVSDQYSSEGADVTLDSTIQPGQEIALHYEYPVTDDEKSALEATGMVGGPMGSGSGGPADWPVIGGVIAGLGSLWAWVTGKLPFGG
jgi:hypothetical protein